MAKRARLVDAKNASEFLSSFDVVLADCDGVLWKGDAAVPGAPAVIQTLARLGKKIFYVTNNSTKSRAAYLKKFQNLGFPAEKEQIYGTSAVVASYLRSTNFKRKAYCIGTTGLQEELDAVGIQYTGFGPDVSYTDSHLDMVQGLSLEDDIGAVIVGFDPHFSYLKMLKGATYLNRDDVLFIATNLDDRFPLGQQGIVMPGTGTFVTAMKTVSRRQPLVMGKPEVLMFEAIRADHNIDPARTIMVGDNVKTDILLGKRCGLKTLLVMTGVTTERELRAFEESTDEEEQSFVPDFYMESIGDLLPLFSRADSVTPTKSTAG